MKFSIRAILVLTAFVALLVAALVAFPPTVATVVLMLLNPMLCAALVAGAIYGREGLRAFCIGAAPSVTMLTFLFAWFIVIIGYDDSLKTVQAWIENFEELAPYVKAHTLIGITFVLVSGLTSVTVRWLLRPR